MYSPRFIQNHIAPAISLYQRMKMRQICYFFTLYFLLPAFLQAGNPFERTKPAPDGPYVFYRGGKIVVKTVEPNDTGMISRTTTYDHQSSVLLTCTIPEKDERFSFLLQDTLKIEPDQSPLPEKMLVLSDIEGNFQGLKVMLRGAKVINKDFKWIFGNGHLVLLGDYFDRGTNVTECLWLIYKLEVEARAAGGKVHFILGNHEVLNLQGNAEYVRGKYIANARLMGETYPQLFDNNTELGRWLRTKHAVEKIGDYLFCHGGYSPELLRMNLSLSDINRITRQYLGKTQASITNIQALAVFNTQTGIFWYRKAAKGNLSDHEIADVLAYTGTKRMVIGHTLVPDLTAHYGGKVICIDLYHEENLRRGFMKTLWIEGGYCLGINSRGEKTSIFSVSFPRKDN